MRFLSLKWCFVAIVALLLVLPTSFQPVFKALLVDAFFAVTVFVAFTLGLLRFLEVTLKIDIAAYNERHPKAQVLVAALLGAMPGCGGAIIVMTQYVQRKVSFGAVIATLTATMGDAAFLLIAKAPLTGLMIIGLGIVIGSLTGWCVNAYHGDNYMRAAALPLNDKALNTSHPLTPLAEAVLPLWWLLLVPGIFLGFMAAFQWPVIEASPVLFGVNVVELMGVLGALSCLLAWTQMPRNFTVSDKQHAPRQMIADVNFITAWVIGAMLLYELTMHTFQIDLQLLFKQHLVWLPLMGTLIGLIPGCGPQILVTGLYLNGLVPFSTQLSNAISNDGDALFPAIAIAPKAAILATLYSAIPALIAGYVYFICFERALL